jgi:hypothetical protein
LEADPGDLPIRDILHLAKNFRTRFLKYSLAFANGRFKKTIDQNKVRAILHLEAPLDDLSPLGKMRDAYPLAIMRVENIVALIGQDAIIEAIARLPMTLCFAAIRLESIPRETRSYLLRISFFLVWKVREMREIGIDPNPETAKQDSITIFTSRWTIRFLDTLLLLIFCIEKYRRLALDRLGTHPLENFFGFVRWDSNDINTAEQMIRTIAHADIAREAGRDLGLEEQLRKRVNLGGVHYDDDDRRGMMHQIEIPRGLDPDIIATICLNLASGYPNLDSEFVRNGFHCFTKYLTALGVIERASQIRGESDQQFACGSGSRILSGFQWHESPIGNIPPVLAGEA